MFSKRAAVVKGLHVAMLTVLVVAAAAQADPGPVSTSGCCNLVKTDCQGCVGVPGGVFGAPAWAKLPTNPYNRCGTTGSSSNGCSEETRRCFQALGGAASTRLYKDNACSDATFFAVTGILAINAPQCPILSDPVVSTCAMSDLP